jgi:hypothetical protein
LQHASPILNKKNSIQNTTYCSAFLPLIIENKLGLAQLALKTFTFSAFVNGVLQLSFKVAF